MTALARWARPGVPLVLLAVAAAFPYLFTGQLTIYYAVLTLIFVGTVVAWNMFSGYTGYISLGHAVFFGSGAYAAGLLALHNPVLVSGIWWVTLPFGGLVAAAVSVPFGLIALRVRRHTFVVVTIAVFFIFQLMAFNLAFTNGNGGVTVFLNWNPATVYNPFYYACLLITVGTIVLSWLVRGSRFGLQLLAIRDDEDRARGLGVRPMRVKLTAFVLSAFITGMLGSLWIFFLGQALPETAFDPNFDLTVALMGFLGGFGTLWGPVLGALILEPLQQQVIQNFSNAAYLGEIVLGTLFLLVILFLPRGLLPTGREWLTALRARWDRRQAAAAGAPPAAPPGAAAPTGAQARGAP